MGDEKLTLAAAAQRAKLSEAELRCAIEGNLLLAEFQQHLGTYTIRLDHLDAYLKSIHHRPKHPEVFKVLIVDDEINFGNLLKLDLQRDHRIQAKFATWGRDGLTLARTFEPDLILLDLMLPDVTAEELLSGLQGLREKRGTRIIVYSAHSPGTVATNPALRERLEVLGVETVMDKTLGLKALTKRVYEGLGLEATTSILKARRMI